MWPSSIPFGLAAVGGAVDFVSLARVVAAAENVFAASRGVGSGYASPLMGVVSRKLLELLALEHSGVPDASRGGAAGGGGGGGAGVCAAARELCGCLRVRMRVWVVGWWRAAAHAVVASFFS